MFNFKLSEKKKEKEMIGFSLIPVTAAFTIEHIKHGYLNKTHFQHRRINPVKLLCYFKKKQTYFGGFEATFGKC